MDQKDPRNYSLRVLSADGSRPARTLREHERLTFTEARRQMLSYSDGLLEDDGTHHPRVGVLLVRKRPAECLTA